MREKYIRKVGKSPGGQRHRQKQAEVDIMRSISGMNWITQGLAERESPEQTEENLCRWCGSSAILGRSFRV